jgi:hypothetical protein
MVAVTSVLVMGLLGTGLTAASAAVGDHSWTGTLPGATVAAGKAAVNRGSVTADWNNKSHALTLSVDTGRLATGRCLTVYFDWTSKGHHDARAVRDCKSNDELSYTFADASTANITGGPEKLGLCYALNNNQGTCLQHKGSMIRMDWAGWPDLSRSAPCDLSWVRRNSDGTTDMFLDPDSSQSRLQPDGAC